MIHFLIRFSFERWGGLTKCRLGWTRGSLKGKKGWFPTDYVEIKSNPTQDRPQVPQVPPATRPDRPDRSERRSTRTTTTTATPLRKSSETAEEEENGGEDSKEKKKKKGSLIFHFMFFFFKNSYTCFCSRDRKIKKIFWKEEDSTYIREFERYFCLFL